MQNKHVCNPSCFCAVGDVEAEDLNRFLSSSVPEMRNSPGLSRRNHVSRVQLRPPRPKPGTRPISMPAERLLNLAKVDKCNVKNTAEQEDACARDPVIEEVSEVEKPKSRVGNHYRKSYIDTQTLRRTWDKQYKHHDITPKSVVITANSHSEVDNGSIFASSTISLSECTKTASAPYSVAVRSGRTLRREGNVSEYCPVPTAFRPPRTLQPPPGTFYKPPGSKNKTLKELKTSRATANSTEEEEDDDDEDEEGFSVEVSVDEPDLDPLDPEPLEQDSQNSIPPQSPSSSPEELGQNGTRPVYQRLRSRRMQDLEHREAHFV